MPDVPAAGSGREFDVLLYGATGFTGRLVAAYLAEHLPEGGTWALAGRTEAKVRDVAREISDEHPDAPEPGVVVADSTDVDSLTAMAERARVVISTVGPYLEHGKPLVAACAHAGTDYVDLAGEPEFVDLMYLEHQEEAERTGARLVSACGFDSIPHDLGVFYSLAHLPADVPLTVYGAVHTNARFSGGTLHSAVGQFARLGQATAAARLRREREGRPEGRRVRSITGRPHHDRALGRWLVPLPTIDPQIVLRSAAADPAYGPDFAYAHFASLGSPLTAVAGMAGVGAIAVGSRIPPVRSRILARADRGTGPDAERRARSSFDVTFVCHAGGDTVLTRVSGGDPGYTETSMMLAESALCLAFDPPLTGGGQLTPAQAMGGHLLARLQRGGLTFEVLEAPNRGRGASH